MIRATVESYIIRTRDEDAALRFVKKALKRHGSPSAITTDGRRSYRAAMKDLGNGQKAPPALEDPTASCGDEFALD